VWALTQNGDADAFMRQDFNQKCRFFGKDVRVETGFWAKNGGRESGRCGVTLDIGLKMRVGSSETFERVGKLTKSLCETCEKWGNSARKSWKKCLKSVKV
jgi:hypothetical protein